MVRADLVVVGLPRGGVPVAVTFCPLCNTAIVFDRRVGERTLDFGTTGRLRFCNLIMYDRQTESWWQQATGAGIAGEFAGAQLTFAFLDIERRRQAEVSIARTQASLRRALERHGGRRERGGAGGAFHAARRDHLDRRLGADVEERLPDLLARLFTPPLHDGRDQRFNP